MLVRSLSVLLALVIGYGLTLLLTTMSSVGHGPNHYYGAPIPVGTSDFDLIAGQLGPETFSFPIFLVDVLLTAAVLLVAGWRGGPLGVFVAGLAGAALLVLVFFMYTKNLGFVGLPIPVTLGSRPPLPEAILVWADMTFWAIVAGFIASRFAARTAAPPAR
jgi:hypothetical protein